MKKTIKDKVDEKRAAILNNICVSVKNTFATEALTNRLSPLEMITVLVTVSYHLCEKISKHFDVDLSELVNGFNDSMTKLLEEDK